MDKHTWEEIYGMWKHIIFKLTGFSISETYLPSTVLSLDVEEPGNNWSGYYYDLWKNEDVDKKLKELKEYSGKAVSLWDSKVGIQTTAEILWECKDDKKKIALTWIAATLWSALKNYPTVWYGETRSLLELVYYNCLEQLPIEWHHSTKEGIPLKVGKLLKDEFIPNNLEKIIKWAALEYQLFSAGHTLVRLRENRTYASKYKDIV